MIWDRSKQNYWICNRYIPWIVYSTHNNIFVCECKPFWDTKLLEDVCFAPDDETVKKLVEQPKLDDWDGDLP